jgi:hypothetical protein
MKGKIFPSSGGVVKIQRIFEGVVYKTFSTIRQ